MVWIKLSIILFTLTTGLWKPPTCDFMLTQKQYLFTLHHEMSQVCSWWKQHCYLYIIRSSCGCASLLHTVLGPAKLIRHLQIAWRWNHITVFRFQFHSLGKYCFKPLLFIKGTSYPLCAAIVLHGPCLQLCPWDNSIRDVQAAELLSCSHKGPRCSDQNP